MANSHSHRRSFRARRPVKGIAIFLVLLLLFAVRLLRNDSDSLPPTPEALPAGTYRVERVVDGDTLLLENRKRVRLIGVDTPETKKEGTPVEAWGPEATAFTEQFVSSGAVRLSFDRERIDDYGRYLAYVWVEDQMLNEKLLEAGLARTRRHYRYNQSMKNRFRKAEEKARAASLGIWSRPQRN